MGHNYFITFTIGHKKKKKWLKTSSIGKMFPSKNVMYFYFVPVIVQRNTVTLTSQRSYVRIRKKGVCTTRVWQRI